MPDSSIPPDQTVDQTKADDGLDSALAAAFGPDSGPPLPAGPSVLRELGTSLPRVQLGEAAAEPMTPVHLPDALALPADPRAGGAGSRLQLLGEIARGGMGAVLRGRDVNLGRDLAVKVLLEAHQDKPDLARRFVEEAQITGQLQHPGIAPVHELGVLPDRRPYFTMKLVQGKTLAALLHERKDLTQNRPHFLTIFGKVCQTLAYAHARGVIHRDLKPSNVMVGAFGEVQVMDWGLAKVLPVGGPDDETKVGRQHPPPEDQSVIRTARSLGSSTPEAGSATEAGSVLGTPAYMAPEQARGDVDLLDERADVFGLGGILCEILTGRPPFTGTGAEAQGKARRADVADAHARLEGCGADAELVALALRCLAPEPAQRPRNAGEVADAITTYDQSVAERLRRAELERAAAEARVAEESRTRQLAEAKAAEERKGKRLALALAAMVLVLIVAGSAGAAWWWHERTAREQEATAREQEAATRERDVEAALAQVKEHQAAGRWPEARAALEKAAGRLGDAGPTSLQERLEQMRRDLSFVAELDDIRLRAADSARGGGFNPELRSQRYLAAFASYGLDLPALDTEEAVARLRNSPIRFELLAAVDDWILHAPHSLHAPLRRVADGADDSDWRRAFRTAVLAGQGSRLKALARDKEALGQPPAVLNWLAVTLRSAGQVEESLALLRQAQRRYPGDFWLNFELGYELAVALRPPRPDEAVGYFRAAVALRPTSAIAHNELGTALQDKGDLDAAILEYEKAIELDPAWAASQANLGNALDVKGNFPGAAAAYQRAIALEPNNARNHYNFAVAFHNHGKPDEAIAEFHRALALEPNYITAHYGLGLALFVKHDLKGAEAEYRKALALNPAFAEAHCNLGAVLRDLGVLAESLAEYRRGHELGSRQPGWRYPSPQWIRDGERLVELDTELAKILKGEPPPTSAAERVALADFCQKPYKRRFAVAVDLYSKAFSAEPGLADGPRLPHRYNAACAAAQAGCGQGDGEPLDARERRRLRTQALKWLRADLKGWTGQVADGPREARAAARQALPRWQTDADLAGLREPAAIEKLPAEEQQACAKLWADVAALLQKAQESQP
jgi:serine/threonine-protein kinase